MDEKPVCVCVAQQQLNKKHKVRVTNFPILLILIHVYACVCIHKHDFFKSTTLKTTLITPLKPRPYMRYVLQILHGHDSGFHFIVAILKFIGFSF